MQEIFDQEPPFSMEFELTEGCPLRCSMCGIKAIRDEKNHYKFMDLKTADRLAMLMARAGWTTRIALAGRGEPSLNPERVEIVKAVRKHLPKNSLTMITNGAAFVKDPNKTIMDLFDAGLTTITMDHYEDCDYVPRIKEKLDIPIPVLYYPEEGTFAAPSRRRTLKQRALIIVQDIRIATKGNHSMIHNYAGFGLAPNDSMAGKPCGKPFREMSVLHNGEFRICCMDWRGLYDIANIHDVEDINDVWNGDFFDAVRRKLYYGEREMTPCKGCDVKTYRVGLLPDKKGQLFMSHLKDETRISSRLRKIPMTAGVPLPWKSPCNE